MRVVTPGVHVTLEYDDQLNGTQTVQSAGYSDNEVKCSSPGIGSSSSMSFLKLPTGSPQPALSTASATGNPRNKVALKPGRSLMDWIRHTQSGRDLTSVGGRRLEVTTTELAKHNTTSDAWIAVRGRVYNVTPYFEYHPGGAPELERGIGMEATDLFDEVHKWVNIESMLGKCYVGKYVSDEGSQKSLQRKAQTKITVPDLGPKLSLSDVQSAAEPPPALIVPDLLAPSAFTPPMIKPTPRYEWFEGETTVSLVIYTKWKHMQHENVVIDKTENSGRKLTLRVADHTYIIHLKLTGEVTGEYQVKVSRPSGKVEVTLHKAECGERWGSLGQPLSGHNSFTPNKDIDVEYRECSVLSVAPVTHDTNLYCIAVPEMCRVCVSTGHHVFVKGQVEGMEMVRSYTTVRQSLLPNQQDSRQDQGQVVYLLVKIYTEGALTPLIGRLQPGDPIEVSNPKGSFDYTRLHDVCHLTMFAAGTGFTPMVGLIYQALVCDLQQNRKVCLVFFNKTEEDILWRAQLQELCYGFTNFEVHHVLSQPVSDWTGPVGRISLHLVEQFTYPVQEGSTPFFCACGPTPFTEEAIRLVKELGYKEDMTHAFLG